MINKEDIKNLALLSRVEVTDKEAEDFTSEVDSILGYVGAVQKFGENLEKQIPKLKNVLRDDEVTNQSGEYKEKLLKNAPSREGDYIKVKKIL